MTTPVTYCTEDDVSARVSALGLSKRIDDDPAFLEDVIDEASSIIEEYLGRGYALDGLPAVAESALNRAVRHWTANIATLLLCERRLNPVPAAAQKKFDRTIASLERVLAGVLEVSGLARRRTAAPLVSNARWKLAPQPHAVIERWRGTRRNQPSDYPQRLDATEHPGDYVG
jgi:phage gp36-like protein